MCLTPAVRLAYTHARMQPHHNLTASYSAQSVELESLISSASAEIIVRQPGENRWSILQIVGHLADAELLASVRIRRIITQDRAKLWSYKQEIWADRLGYQQRKIETVVARFVLLRRENAELLTGLPESVWLQTGEHNEDGALSLRQLIEGYVSHTAKHLNQIEQMAVSKQR
ncbi:MAG: DinB family protein [Blastocatellia bacterium]